MAGQQKKKKGAKREGTSLPTLRQCFKRIQHEKAKPGLTIQKWKMLGGIEGSLRRLMETE
jgi:hypothetical protein